MLNFLRLFFTLWTWGLLLHGCSTPLYQEDRDGGGDGGAPVVQPTLRLSFVPSTALQLRPASTVLVRVEAVNAQGLPMPDVSLRFSLLGDSADTTLSQTRVVTAWSADHMTAAAEVSLIASTVSSDFSIRVLSPDGASATRDVSVSDHGFGSIVASFSYDGVRGATQFELSLVADARCEALTSNRAIRTTRVMGSTRGVVRFDSLAAGRTFAVVADGYGPEGERVAAGCVESVTVAPDIAREIPLQMRDFPLRSEGRYVLELQLGLDVVATQAAALWRESTRMNADEAGTILYAVSDAVERTSGPAVRAQFDTAIDSQLRQNVEAALRTRDSLPSSLIRRWSQAIAATVGGTRWEANILATIRDGRTQFVVERVQITVDPQTPELIADDITREVTAGGSGTIESLAGDRVVIDLDAVSMPVSTIALTARDAHLGRVRAESTAARLRSSIRCDLLDSVVRPFAGSCDQTCVVEACERVLTQWAQNFDDALVSSTSSLRNAQASFVGVARAPTGSVTLSRVATGAVEGLFVQDPSRPVRGVGTLTRP